MIDSRRQLTHKARHAIRHATRHTLSIRYYYAIHYYEHAIITLLPLLRHFSPLILHSAIAIIWSRAAVATGRRHTPLRLLPLCHADATLPLLLLPPLLMLSALRYWLLRHWAPYYADTHYYADTTLLRRQLRFLSRMHIRRHYARLPYAITPHTRYVTPMLRCHCWYCYDHCLAIAYATLVGICRCHATPLQYLILPPDTLAGGAFLDTPLSPLRYIAIADNITLHIIAIVRIGLTDYWCYYATLPLLIRWWLLHTPLRFAFSGSVDWAIIFTPLIRCFSMSGHAAYYAIADTMATPYARRWLIDYITLMPRRCCFCCHTLMPLLLIPLLLLITPCRWLSPATLILPLRCRW